MKNSKIFVIAAVSEKNGIGKNGKMPWSFKKEMQHFKNTTTKTLDPTKQNALLMGKTTWYSLPKSLRPLSDRKNVVLSFEPDEKIEVAQFTSIEKAVEALKSDQQIENIFIIGGASVYKQFIENFDLDGLYITKIHKQYDCDTFFPEIPQKYSKIETLGKEIEKGIEFEFLLFT